MFKNVVVGVDGSEGGRNATALARILRAENGKVDSRVHLHGNPQVRARVKPVLRRRRGGASPRTAGAGARGGRTRSAPQLARFADGRPRTAQLAEAIGADLLVIGSSSAACSGACLSPTTRAALNGASCAVATPRRVRGSRSQCERSASAMTARLRANARGVARKLAAQRHAELSAFGAIAFPTYVFTGPFVAIDATLEEIVDAARERVAALEESSHGPGQPAEELALYSASLDRC